MAASSQSHTESYSGSLGPECDAGKAAQECDDSSRFRSGSEAGKPQANEEKSVARSDRNGKTATAMTLSNLPGDLGSITAIWTGRPDSLQHAVTLIASARRDNASTADKTTAAWAVATIAPRTVLHLASWVLADPLRTLLAIVAIAITALSL